ncbi:MAG: NAD-dependent epimerase/dehydratase family protein [Gammaproteobacteria bacterium]|nr:NAD-dependent epimerase/dehydratase family protein [Gammaproteobacteria bacterium]
MNVAILGAGFIGKRVIKNLLASGHTVQVLDRNPCPDEFVDKVKWITSECQDQRSVEKVLQDVTVAYHLASSTVPGDQHVDVAIELKDNVVSILGFVDSCLKTGVKRIVFASSSSVYGVQHSMPINELAPTNPISTHGIHKLMVEKFLLLAQHLHGIQVRILRIANPYGPSQSILGRQGFIAMAIGHILNNSPIILRDNGKPVRDFIFIDDLAEAAVQAGIQEKLPSVINIGTGIGLSLREILNQIEKLINCEVKITPTESRQVDIPVSILDVSLMNSVMRFIPSTSFQEGLSITLTYHGLIPEIS